MVDRTGKQCLLFSVMCAFCLLLPAHNTKVHIHLYGWRSNDMTAFYASTASTHKTIKGWEVTGCVIKGFKASPVTFHTATCVYFAAVPNETHLVAQRVCRKDKFTDDQELWPHAISRHQSGDSTILGLRKAWPEVTSTSCRSCRCSLSQYTVDRIERTLQTKNTNAWKLL